jgi:hypothetical protein
MAAEFIKTASAQWSGVTNLDNTVELLNCGKQLVDQGCRDPLVLYLVAHLNRSVANYTAAMHAVEENPKVSRSLAWFVATDFAESQGRTAAEVAELDQKAIQWLKSSLTDGSYEKGDDIFFVRHQVWREKFHKRQCRTLATLYAEAPLPEWARHTLVGMAEIDLAWAARGGDWADKVTEEGWKGFEEHLQKAHEELGKGWQLRQDRPEAAAAMINVIGGGHRVKGETIRLWFDRAIAAQFDYMPAYNFVLWFYRPRWGGSHQLMFDFGKACLNTKRFDTDVPLKFYTACNSIGEEMGDTRIFRGQPEVRKLWIELDQALVNEPTRKHQKQWRLSYLAVDAWMAGDYALAAQTLAAIGPKLEKGAVEELRKFGIDESQFRRLVASVSGSGRK